MAKKLALTRRAQYQAVYKSGKVFTDSLLVVKILSNGLDTTRIGFSVSKEVGKAVVRNHRKRLLKEIVRMLEFKSGLDIVFIARRNIINADFKQLQKSVVGLLNRACILENNVEKIGS